MNAVAIFELFSSRSADSHLTLWNKNNGKLCAEHEVDAWCCFGWLHVLAFANNHFPTIGTNDPLIKQRSLASTPKGWALTDPCNAG